MPIVFQKEVNPQVKLAVWHIEEDISENLPLLHKSDKTDVKKDMVEKKQLETIATRLLIKSLVEKSGRSYSGITKDEHGKPHLKGHQDLPISISHAFPYAAAIIDGTSSTGIDIEASREQIERIRHKFMSDIELDNFKSIDEMTIIWAAKECLYKIHGRKRLIFRRHLAIKRVDDETLIGEVKDERLKESYQLKYQKIDSQWLVYKEFQHN